MVRQEVLDRVDSSSLTRANIKAIEDARPTPDRWFDCVFDAHWECENRLTVWDTFPSVMPFAVVDRRIFDLAINFWEKPDERLLTGYRRLEDNIRARIGSQEHGRKLFSQAFMGTRSKLMWEGVNEAEQTGRANLFVGAYMAYRSPRAHRELQEVPSQQLTEFLLLNQLYSLERDAEPRPGLDEGGCK